jgi:hypothetical protein
MLESIAAGTTTVVEHAHIIRSPEHAKAAIAGTASSGMRSVFCYTPMMIVTQFNSITWNPTPFEDWAMNTFDELADNGPFGDGRVTLGFAFDLWCFWVNRKSDINAINGYWLMYASEHQTRECSEAVKRKDVVWE